MPAPEQVQILYQHHHGWLQRWLTSRLGDSQWAADLAQDTFLRILVARRPPELREPRAYLTTVAKGVLSNWRRRQQLEQAYLQALAALPVSWMRSEEEHALVLEALHEIDALLDGLPAQARQAFLLAQIEGLTYPEVAERLGLSLATVKRHVKRAFLACLASLASHD